MVCDKERWCVCVCDKVACVCERWCVWKLCVKDSVWQRWCVTKMCVKDGVWKMVCDKVVCERWCVTKLCVKDGVWQSCVWKMVCDKVVCERGCVTKMVCERWCVKDGVWQRWCVTKMAVCERVEWHQSQPSAISDTPATQNEGGCHQVPRLPRKVLRRHRRLKPAQARHQSQPSAISATPATQGEGGCDQVPLLPRETKVDVTKCHACHAKCRGVTGDHSGPSAPPEPAQCHKCHACHAKRRWMWPMCHACHVKRRWMWPSATPATQSAAASPATKTGQSTPPEPAQCHKCHACHAKNEGGCDSVPRLPRETKVDVTRLSHELRRSIMTQPRTLVVGSVHLKLWWLNIVKVKKRPGPTIGAPQELVYGKSMHHAHNCSVAKLVPRVPRKVPRRHRRLKPAQARHQSQPSAISATPATQNEGGCDQVPCLPRETKVDVTKCHACHTKCRGVTGD